MDSGISPAAPPPLRTQDRPLPGRNTHSGRRRRLWIKREREKYKKLKSGVLKAGGVSFIVGVTGIFLTVYMNKIRRIEERNGYV